MSERLLSTSNLTQSNLVGSKINSDKYIQTLNDYKYIFVRVISVFWGDTWTCTAYTFYKGYSSQRSDYMMAGWLV